MLKSQTFTLGGRDEGTQVTLTELPALVADRHARAALKAVDEPTEGGIVALALHHLKAVRALGEASLALLQPFVQGADLRTIKDWRSVERLQQGALLLHVGFLLGRESVEIPITLIGKALLSPAADVRAMSCSPHIAAVLHSDKASYVELETVLSTEDVYNLVELLNVDAIREWHIQQSKGTP